MYIEVWACILILVFCFKIYSFQAVLPATLFFLFFYFLKCFQNNLSMTRNFLLPAICRKITFLHLTDQKTTPKCYIGKILTVLLNPSSEEYLLLLAGKKISLLQPKQLKSHLFDFIIILSLCVCESNLKILGFQNSCPLDQDYKKSL